MPQSFADIDALVTNTYEQLVSVQSLKASLVTQKAALVAASAADPMSVSDGGEGGGENVSLQTLTQQIAELAQVERDLTETYEKQVQMRQDMFPFVRRNRVRVGGSLI